MNTVIMMGRLVNDPDVRYTQGEKATAIARFRMAVNRRFKRDGQPDADFFDCVAFGKLGEFSEKYLAKGTKVVIQGRLQNDNYTNKDGQMVYRTTIVLETVEFAESKGTGKSQGAESAQKAAPVQEDADGFMNIPDNVGEELPFC